MFYGFLLNYEMLPKLLLFEQEGCTLAFATGLLVVFRTGLLLSLSILLV